MINCMYSDGKKVLRARIDMNAQNTDEEMDTTKELQSAKVSNHKKKPIEINKDDNNQKFKFLNINGFII